MLSGQRVYPHGHDSTSRPICFKMPSHSRWRAGSVGEVCESHLGVVGSSPTLGVDLTKTKQNKNPKPKKPQSVTFTYKKLENTHAIEKKKDFRSLYISKNV